MTEEADIVIVGGGIVGLCVGLTLAHKGQEVLIVDHQGSDIAASAGNAGVIANFACVPLGTPALLKGLPRLLFSASSPLSIKTADIFHLAPWLLRFAMASVGGGIARNALALHSLLKDAIDACRDLLSEANARHLLVEKGALHLFHTEQESQAGSFDFKLRETCGVAQQNLSRSDIEALEPGLGDRFECGTLFPDAAHIRDPVVLLKCLRKSFVAAGGAVVHGRVTNITPEKGRVAVRSDSTTLHAHQVVLCAGAWSGKLAAGLGDRIPLAFERGYHLEFEGAPDLLNRPVCPVSLGFYLTPMNGRTRAAGTVELGRTGRAPDPARLGLIERGARSTISGLRSNSSTWSGYRPSTPDSMPVIGRSPNHPEIIYAFGHGHLGLTLAPVTARIVEELLAGREAEHHSAFSPRRFQ